MFKGIKEDSTNEEIQATIEHNYMQAARIREKITLLHIDESRKTTEETLSEETSIIGNISCEDTREEDFEDEIKYYLEDYRNIPLDFEEGELFEILPSKDEYNYERIIYRLIAESTKEIKELMEIVRTEELTKSDLEDIKLMINNEKRKQTLLKRSLTEQKGQEEMPKINNTIILAPSSSGSIRLINDLKHITPDYYPAIKILIENMKKGKFKRVKRLSDISGMCQVREGVIRIIFQRISHRTYALVTAFMKKGDMDRAYYNYLRTRVTDYNSIRSKLIENIDRQDFLEENNQNLDELFNLLNQNEPTSSKGGKII